MKIKALAIAAISTLCAASFAYAISGNLVADNMSGTSGSSAMSGAASGSSSGNTSGNNNQSSSTSGTSSSNDDMNADTATGDDDY